MNDSNFPNGVCKQCHESVVVMMRKNDLKEGIFAMNANSAVTLVKKKTSDDISTFHQ